MKYNPITIVSGLLFLFGFSYVLITLYTALYLKYAAKAKPQKRRLWLATAIVTLAWLVATIVSVMFASSNGPLVFATISMLLIFAFNYFLVGRTLPITGRHKIFYSLVLSVIINPIWYFMLG